MTEQNTTPQQPGDYWQQPLPPLPAQPTSPQYQTAPSQPVQPQPQAAPSQPVQPQAAPAQPVQPQAASAQTAQDASSTVPQAGVTPPQSPYATAPQPSGSADGKATGALVCGILSILLCSSVVPSIILGIVAIVLGGKALKLISINGKAKAGRVCGIIGIVLSVISAALISFLLVWAVGTASSTSSDDFSRQLESALSGTGLSTTSSNETAVRQAVDTQMQTLQNPSISDLSSVADALDSSFGSMLGASLSDLGISASDMATWLTGDMTYSITKVNVSGSTATAYLTVSSRDVDGFLDTFENDVTKLMTGNDYSSASMSDILAQVGTIMKDDMAKTGTTQKMTSLDLNKLGSTWAVDDYSLAELEYDVYSIG